jgi:hypothetical protein
VRNGGKKIRERREREKREEREEELAREVGGERGRLTVLEGI